MAVSVTIGGVPIGDTGSPRVVPATLLCSSDVANGIAGPSTASFTLRADPRDALPALDPFTPVQVDVDGERIWSGFAWTATRTGRTVAVTCNGTKAHLDGDLISLTPLDSTMGGWLDEGILLSASGAFNSNPPPSGSSGSHVSSSQQGLVLTYPNTPSGYSNSAVYCITAIRPVPYEVLGVVIAYAFSGSIGGRIRVWRSDSISNTYGPTYALDQPDTAPGLFNVSSSVGRYLKIGWGFSPSTSIPAAQTCTVMLIWLYDGASATVHGSDVALRVRQLVPQLSRDTSQIQATSAVMLGAAWKDQPPSTVLNDAAAYDDPLVGVDAYDRLVYRPRSPLPVVELPSRAPASTEAPTDPSVLVSAVEVSGPSPSGVQITRRYTPLDLLETPVLASGATVPNPNFAANVASWTPTGGSQLTRVGSGGPTGGPATYAVWTSSPSGNLPAEAQLITTITGTLKAGVPVAITFWLAESVALGGGKAAILAPTVQAWVFDPADPAGVATQTFRLPIGSWQQFVITFTPRMDASSATLLFFDAIDVPANYPDGLSAYYCSQPAITGVRLWQLAQPGPLSGRGVVRTGQITVQLITNDDICKGIGQTYLRGQIRQGPTATRVAADGAARDPTSHAPLGAATLIGKTGGLARIADRVDIAGHVGASMYISQVDYDHAAKSSTVILGQRYASYQQLLTILGGVA